MSALETVHDIAEHRRRPAEELAGRLHIPLGQQLADPGGRHPAIGVDRAHDRDDVDPEAEFAPQLAQAAQGSGLDQSMPADKLSEFLQFAGFQATFTEGATNAFLIGSIMMLAASVIVWIFLDVKHAELATDGPEGVHVG